MKRSTRKVRRGFSLVEIMIVVLIMGVLLNIALPNFARARETSRAKACQSNLKQTAGAKEMWALATNQPATATPSWSQLAGPGLFLRSRPQCPNGGIYLLRDLNNIPTCSIGTNRPGAQDDHILP